METRQRMMKGLYVACSIFGIGYCAVSLVALFVGGGMRTLFYSAESTVCALVYMAAILFWWVSFQLYLRSLPEPKLPDWAKKLCIADIAAFAGVLLLRLAEFYLF